MIQTLIWGNQILWFENGVWVHKRNASKAGGWQPCSSTVISGIWCLKSGLFAELASPKARAISRVKGSWWWTTFCKGVF